MRRASSISTFVLVASLLLAAQTTPRQNPITLQGGIHWQFLRWQNGYFLGFNSDPHEAKILAGVYDPKGALQRSIASDQYRLDEGFLVDAAVSVDGTVALLGFRVLGKYSYMPSDPHKEPQKILMPGRHEIQPFLIVWPPNESPREVKLTADEWPRKICAAPKAGYFLFGEIGKASLVYADDLGETLRAKPLLGDNDIARDPFYDFRSMDTRLIDVRQKIGPNFFGEWLLCSPGRALVYHAPSLSIFEITPGGPSKRYELARPLLLARGAGDPAMKALSTAKAFRGAAITTGGRVFALVEDVEGGVQLYELKPVDGRANWAGVARWPLLSAPYRRLIGAEGEELIFVGSKIASDTVYRVRPDLLRTVSK